MFKKQKKGIQLNQAFGAVLTLVLVAILVIVAIYMVSSLQTSFPLTSLTTTNETGAYINSTGYQLKNMTLCRASSPAITQILNTTSATVITSGNYTLSATGLVTNATAATYTNVKISYTNQWGDSVCDASASIITQFATYPALVGLVGTIIFLALVIGVLVASFAFGGRRGA